jgi:hypothetical protein
MRLNLPLFLLPLTKITVYTARQDSLRRTLAMALTGLAALVAILVVSFGYIMVALF